MNGGLKSGCSSGYWRLESGSVALLAVVKRLEAMGGGRKRFGLNQ